MNEGYVIGCFILGLVLPFCCFTIYSEGDLIGLAIFLVWLTIRYDFSIPELNAFTISFSCVTSIQLFLILLKFYQNRSDKKNKFLAAPYFFKLPGQTGNLIKDIVARKIGVVRLNDPLFENAEMDCIADEDIRAGENVKVLEVDCGLLKVTKKTR